jgi:hypothetical protein
VSAHPFFDYVSKLRDAQIVSPLSTEVLAYDAAVARWKNSTLTSSTEGVWNFSTNLTQADPGSGKLRVNNAVFLSATSIAISKFSIQGIDRSNVLQALKSGDQLFLQDKTAATTWIRYNVTANSIDNLSWFQIPVAAVEGSGTTPGNNDDLIVSFQSSGAGGGGGGPGFVTGETPSGAINGINQNYVTGSVFIVGSLVVYANGLRMRSGPDYVVTGAQNFQMVTPLTTGDNLMIDYRT